MGLAACKPDLSHLSPFKCLVLYQSPVKNLLTFGFRVSHELCFYHKESGLYRKLPRKRNVRANWVPFFKTEFPGASIFKLFVVDFETQVDHLFKVPFMVPAIDFITLPTSNQLLSCAQKEKVFSCFADDLVHILIWENSDIDVALGCHDDSGNNSVSVSFSLKTECDQNYGHSGQKYFLCRNRRVDYTVAALADLLIITEDDPILAAALCSCQQVC